jgi:hypothetical protein
MKTPMSTEPTLTPSARRPRACARPRASVATVASALAGLLAAALPPPARAQDDADMTFTIEDTGEATGQAAAPAEGPPSEALANALRLYQQERYAEAAVQFQRVVEGETADAPANVQKAQFFLGKSLYHFSLQGAANLYFDQTLQWLAQLASQLPEPAGIIEKVGRYGVDQLEQFNRDETRELYNQLQFIMGRYKYQQGEFEGAIELFQNVQEDSRFFVQAKFFAGITHVRLRQARPAVQAFRGIIDRLDAGNVVGVEDEARMRNLAWISLARVYYTAANQTDEQGNMNVDGRLLGQAVEGWNQVEQSSEYWLDALFETSWAFFLADEYSRALGNIHTLFSPYFDQAYYPEALVLKAVTFFVNCQVDNAEAIIGQFHERYDPVKQELEQVLAQYQDDNTQFFQFLERVRAGEANLSPRIRGIVSSALSDRTLLRNVEYVRLLENEEARLNSAPEQFRNSSLGARILQDIVVAKTFAIDQTGDLARARYNRLIDELQDLTNDILKIEIEIAAFKRGELTAEAQGQMAAAQNSGGGDVVVDEEHQLWPFDGEYWRDELGFYRQQVSNQCSR